MAGHAVRVHGEQRPAHRGRHALRRRRVYTIEIGGESDRYLLPGYGWDSTIQAIADLDSDGKPDFFISLGGPNAGTEAVLLSSQARPGRNPPTATLTAFGC